jgi:hypothetical protein
MRHLERQAPAQAPHRRRLRTATSRLLAAALLFWTVQPGRAIAEIALETNKVTALINAAEPGVADAAGWAQEILDNLAELDLPQEVENVVITHPLRRVGLADSLFG